MADTSGPRVPGEGDEVHGGGSSGAAEATAGSHSGAGDVAAAGDGAGVGADRVDATGTVAIDASGDAPADEPGLQHTTTDPVTSTTIEPPAIDTVGSGSDPAAPDADDTIQPRSDGGGDNGGGGKEGDNDSGGKEGDEVDDEDDAVEDVEDEPRKGSLLTRQVQIDARTILIIVAVFAIGVGAYVLGQKQARDANPSTTNAAAPPTTRFTLPKDFVPFDDKETGIKLAVPKDWVAYSTKDLDQSYRLLVGVPNAKDNLRVRMNAYSTPVTRENIGDQQAVVDSIFAEEKIQILARETPTVNGMPALYYVYKFTDASGEPGYHAHFFVFQGRKMVSLVFEAVPEDRFALLAPVFDEIANSLQVVPGDPPAFLQEATGSGATIPPGSGPAAPSTPSSAP